VTRRLFGTLCGFGFLVNLGRVGFAPLVQPLVGAFDASEATLGLLVTVVWLGTAAARVPTGYVLMRVPRQRVVLATDGALAAVAAPTLAVAVLAIDSWRRVFLALAAGAVLTTLVLSRTVTKAPQSSTRAPDRTFSDAVRAHWPLLVTAIVLVALAGFVWQGVFNFYPMYLIRAKGLSPALANTLLTLVVAAGVPAFWFGGRLADRLPHVPFVFAIIASFAGSLLVLTYTVSLVGLVVVTAAMGYAFHSLFPALDAFLLGSLPTDADASGYAVYSGGALSLEATGSVAVGTLVGRDVSFETVFRAGALGLGVVLVALCVLYWLDRLPGARSGADPDPDSESDSDHDAGPTPNPDGPNATRPRP
jgi:predicted MFS family arabinose efflux permease